MRVGLIADEAWLDDELGAMTGLIQGLDRLGISCTAVLPPRLEEPGLWPGTAAVFWEPSTWPILDRWRIQALRDRLLADRCTVVHAVSVDTWTITLDVAGAARLPVVLSISGPGELERAATCKHRLHGAATRITVPTDAMRAGTAKALSIPQEQIDVVPAGVPAQSGLHDRPPAADNVCIAVLCGAEPGPGLGALIGAVKELTAFRSGTQFFFDAIGRDSRYMWRAANQAGVLHNVNMVQRRLGHHEMLLYADVIVVPEPSGRLRWPVLSSAAAGLPIVALADETADPLEGYPLLTLVHQQDAPTWTGAIRPRIERASEEWSLRADAARWTAEHFPAAEPARLLAQVYHGCAGTPLKFNAARP